MKVGGKHYNSIWLNDDGWSISVIDQRVLPHRFNTVRLSALEQVAAAIVDMTVRGAPLIGITAAYGLCIAVRKNPTDDALMQACGRLKKTRPTAVNLFRLLDELCLELMRVSPNARAALAYQTVAGYWNADIDHCYAIGQHGKKLLEGLWPRAQAKGRTRLNVLTHCNAGWLATVDWGTALAPIYLAHDAGIPVHVWVDETRPRNQGSSLTAWELAQHGVDHTLIVDNVGGHLMQRGEVDCCIVGADRVTRSGDVCNKIGTYLKALAAWDNDVPFYVALPESSIDWQLTDGILQVPIEQRDGREVSHVRGLTPAGEHAEVAIVGGDSKIANYGFDVTPARLVSALITESGVCEASSHGLAQLYPDCADG